MRRPTKKVEVGHRINKLTVIDNKPIKVKLETGSMYSKYRVRCDCGTETTVVKHALFDGRTVSCGCYQYVERTKPLTESPAYKLYSDYRSRAKKKHLCFELSFEQFKIITQQNCFYCNKKPKQVRRCKRSYIDNVYIYNGIDRKDNSKGYDLKNALPCCKTCNTAKSDLTEEEFFNWLSSIYLNLKEKFNV